MENSAQVPVDTKSVPVKPQVNSNPNMSKALLIVLVVLCLAILSVLTVIVVFLYNNNEPVVISKVQREVVASKASSISSSASSNSSKSVSVSPTLYDNHLGLSFYTNNFFSNPIETEGIGNLFDFIDPVIDLSKVSNTTMQYAPTDTSFVPVRISIIRFGDPAVFDKAKNAIQKDQKIFNCDLDAQTNEEYTIQNTKYKPLICANGESLPNYECPIGTSTDEFMWGGYYDTRKYIFLKNMIVKISYDTGSSATKGADGKCTSSDSVVDPKSLDAAKALIESIKYL
ncbi:MAG: hypothetical protein WCO33_01630 [bacterium]